MMTTLETPRKRRVVMRIQLTAQAKAELTELGDRLGVPQNRIMSRLLEWFCAQHRIMQNLVLGLVPAELRQQTAAWAIPHLR